MQYVLAIGILAKLYKSPTIRIFLNDTLVDEIKLEQDIGEKKMDFALFHSQLDTTKSKYTTSLPAKFFIYHIDDHNLSDENYLKLNVSDCLSNYTNGFMSKSDQYIFRKIWFAPRKFFFKSKENFIEDFQSRVLDENNFIWDNDSGGFYNKKTKVADMPGWPLPFICEKTKTKFHNDQDCYQGVDREMSYKIVKKYGIYQFEYDMEDIDVDPKASSSQWVQHIQKNEITQQKDKIWPIDNAFLCFCYHNRNNKYLHENQ